MSDGFDELHRLALDLENAPKEAIPNIVTAVGVSAEKGTKAWRAAAAKHSHAGRYPATIDYDPVTAARAGVLSGAGVIGTTIGPTLGKRGAFLGIVEDSPGGVQGSPQRNYIAAEQAIEDDLPQGIEKAIDQAHRKNRL